jgi:FkbM family methyltransferase
LSKQQLEATNLHNQHLVYDVGLFDGTDTAYYLSRGSRVVAIDANPIMVENAKARFAGQISTGQLILINAGIAADDTDLTFWSSAVPAWSSFNRDIASRHGTEHQPIKVPVVTFGEILKTHGMPHYLKIDIEGNDHLCVEALKFCERIPEFISVESECVGDDDRPTDNEVLTTLRMLRMVGYRRFKLLNQQSRRAARPGAAAALIARVVESLAEGRLKRLGLASLARPLTDAGRISRRTGHDFTIESSGPLAVDIPGPWMTFVQAEQVYLRERRRYFATGDKLQSSFWQDWHATL